MKVGVDIVQISRIESLKDKYKKKFLNRVFTDSEITYIDEKGRNPDTIAGLYAAKEAISKALGTGIGQVSWKDLDISHDEKDKPFLSDSLKLKPILNELDIGRFEISISHDGDYAIAFVIGY